MTMTTSTTTSTTASTTSTAAAGSASERYLTFALGGEKFALPILDVTEILEFRSLTTVPMMPPYIRGVLNLRGRVVPVVDLSVRFGGEPTQVNRRTSIVIIDAGARTTADGEHQRVIGILVDAVNKVMLLSDDDVVPPPTLGADGRSDFVHGMARHHDEFIVVLDLTPLATDAAGAVQP
jgi:purine-binding chemotaxis protein CheW